MIIYLEEQGGDIVQVVLQALICKGSYGIEETFEMPEKYDELLHIFHTNNNLYSLKIEYVSSREWAIPKLLRSDQKFA
jgi:hypothetical protein